MLRTLSPATNWQHTLESVAADTDVCICFQPGDFVTTKTLEFRNKNVRIHGDGGASRIHGKGIETVFQFTGCLTATVSDISVDADTLLPKQSGKPHLSGAITTIGCGQVDISKVTARCTSGPATSSSAISVYSEFAADRALSSSARIQGCDIIAGANQVGLSVINYGRKRSPTTLSALTPGRTNSCPPAGCRTRPTCAGSAVR